MNKKREDWIDVAKGLGIVAVVIGHSGRHIVHDLLFWFHMPLFFILSGYLDKGLNDWKEFKPWLFKRSKQLLIPYISFTILLLVGWQAIEFYKGNGFSWLTSELPNLLIAGRFIGGWFSVLWFVTCLLITQILFNVIHIQIKSTSLRVLVVALIYIFAHLEAQLINVNDFYIPWNADVALYTLSFYTFGYYFKRFSAFIFERKSISLIILISSAALLTFGALELFTYTLDLKSLIYTNPILDFVIPIILSLGLVVISKFISDILLKQPLVYLGKQSLTIMYTHLAAVGITDAFIDLNYFTFSLLGLVLPLLGTWLVFQRYEFTRLLFLGEIKKVSTPKFSYIEKKAN